MSVSIIFHQLLLNMRMLVNLKFVLASNFRFLPSKIAQMSSEAFDGEVISCVSCKLKLSYLDGNNNSYEIIQIEYLSGT